MLHKNDITKDAMCSIYSHIKMKESRFVSGIGAFRGAYLTNIQEYPHVEILMSTSATVSLKSICFVYYA